MEHIEQEDSMEVISFTAHDRCDRCGSQALALAERPGLTELLFCKHHKDKYEDGLLNSGWTVTFDQSTYDSYRIPVHVQQTG